MNKFQTVFKCYNHKVAINVLTVFIGLLLTGTLFASEDTHDQKNAVGFFVGVLDGEEADGVIGIEYEYKLSRHWGVGALYEYAPNAYEGAGVRSTMASVYFHPNHEWRINLGAGEEEIKGEHSDTGKIYRIGIGYDFHYGSIGVSPSFNIDRANSEISRVFGVSFTKSF